ncbi:beta-1,3-galactosyltransferase brn [Copidosoma floridanum]|uniref:beta-1,3-galactosyltransferase brn n=1 Tax=Copidosoma floridanum TaxID=29053 RepID=UPI0006C9D65B|nr:beta-1,3-galactosyltransferase brn [Copidosoma floridanum]
MHCILRSACTKIAKLFFAIKLRHICIGCSLIFILDFFGLFTHMFEVPFDENFSYPYKGDIHEFVAALRHNEKPSVSPINIYNYTFIRDIRNKCLEPRFQTLRIVLLVKSAVENFANRIAIRHSWGFEKRFSDVPLKTIFLLGVHSNDDQVKAKIDAESIKYQDIVQADFQDSYYNNTIKTMMGFHWAFKFCLNSKYYVFVDDDMYISVKNILKFLKNPTLYPDYLKDGVNFNERPIEPFRKKRSMIGLNAEITGNKSNGWLYKSRYGNKTLDSNSTVKFVEITRPRIKMSSRKRRQLFDFELPEDVRLFAGFTFRSAPHRHKSSKWYVSLKEYPYHLWPPYVTAGSYVLSKEALLDMYFASMYTKYFRFDDIFLALVAKKAGIEPFHCEEFHFYKKDYTKYNYKYVISSHGYGDPDELLKVWNEQKALGNA